MLIILYNYIVIVMRMKKKYKIILFVLLLCIIFLISIIIWKHFFSYEKVVVQENNDFDEQPVFVEHNMEFDIKESNYIEENYERYLEYKKKHSEYSDDTIITYVNIGLDRDFYTNMEPTDMSDGYLLICNKFHYLKSNYVPNLKSLPGSYGGGQMEKVAADAFMKMADAAKKDGYSLRNVSGYRSYNTQKYLYNNYVSRDGVKNADTYSARPGSSEHQTGLATDINTASSAAHFENTKTYAWLIKNSYKYGFILRYPEGKTFITGYKYEPWHYRYVGIEVAKIIYDKQITYEEYYATYMMKG